MTQDELNNAYLSWMYELVYDKRYLNGENYYRLFRLLHNIEFTYTIDMDGNRYEDGIDLRYRFANTNHIRQAEIARRLDIQPCSVLEMMVALAIRLEEHIMDNPDIGNRTGQWFWTMIESLGLDCMYDDRFDYDYARKIIQRFLDRDYELDGRGGLFTVKHCEHDLRDVEIWYQACWYLNSIG